MKLKFLLAVALGGFVPLFAADLPVRPPITGLAHKLARLSYRLLKWGHAYVDKGLQCYEERHREQQVQLLRKRAAKLGLQLVAPEVA